jgi:diguanylate cyclase (GGDEF)-like protein
MSNDLIDIVDDSAETSSITQKPNSNEWQVLIVDDESAVHDATKIVFNGFEFSNKNINFTSAYSAEAARKILETHYFAVIVLDVVMETHSAGLELVTWLRHSKCIENTRIVLRTGQPGYAPEVEVIQKYDINDYLQKGELTREKFWTAMTTALRSYQQIEALAQSRKGLQLIIDASAALSKLQPVSVFAQGVLYQLSAQLKSHPDGMFVTRIDENGNLKIIASVGKYSVDESQSPLSENIKAATLKAFTEKENLLAEDGLFIYLESPNGDEAVIRLDGNVQIDEIENDLLKMFCSNMALSYENVQLFERIQNIAFVDSLTSLGTHEKLTQDISQSEPRFGSIALIDIDYFHEINESLGVEFGDQLLRNFASLLKTSTPPECTIARLHSDVFGVFYPKKKNLDFQNIIEDLNSQISFENSRSRFGVTAGITTFENSDLSAEKHLHRAEIALKMAKQNHRGTFLEFQTSFEEATDRRRSYLQRLRSAIRNNELQLHYQPKLNIESGETVGAEALLRWNSPKFGYVSPMEFIPVAESSGLIVEFGYWVLEEASKSCTEWKKLLPNMKVAVNISAVQLREPDFADKVLAAIRRGNAGAKDIELEITESIAADEERSIQVLKQLKKMGFQISLDDFGTGYSSLSYLQRFPIDSLKIDRAFIKRLKANNVSSKLFEIVIKLADILKLTTIVEGVETEEQAKIVTNLGGEIGQGYYWSKPLSKSDMKEFLLNNSQIG